MIWLAISLPLAILAIWLFTLPVTPTLLLSILLALPLAVFMWFSVQSSNLIYKWPALQLLGLTTILITVLLVTAPLHLFMQGSAVGGIALISWALLAIYAAIAALRVKNIHLTLHSPKLRNKKRIVHLSDIHAGSRSSKFLNKIVEQTISHQPDAVVITGDLLDSSAVDESFLAPLKNFTCPVWMSLGNHERYVDLAQAIEAIEKQQVSILRNTSSAFEDIHIIGIDDTDNPKDAKEELGKLNIHKDRFNILLYHRPDGWQAAVEHRIDLMLAGHTHAGQIWPFGLLVRLQFPQLAGYFSHDHSSESGATQAKSHLVVSQGTGTWGPTLRLGTRSEIIVLDLHPAG
jgi:predicted MPP superfamily phosphohydrolase